MPFCFVVKSELGPRTLFCRSNLFLWKRLSRFRGASIFDMLSSLREETGELERPRSWPGMSHLEASAEEHHTETTLTSLQPQRIFIVGRPPRVSIRSSHTMRGRPTKCDYYATATGLVRGRDRNQGEVVGVKNVCLPHPPFSSSRGMDVVSRPTVHPVSFAVRALRDHLPI